MGIPLGTVMASARSATSINLAADTLATFQALWIGTTGDVVVDMIDGGTGVTIKSVPAGMLPIYVTKVYSTANGTSASNLVGLRW